MTVRREIDSVYSTALPRTREILKALPEHLRVCPEHGEEVTIQESDFSSNPGTSAPFAKAAFVGCCDTAIDNAISGIMRPPSARQ